MGQRGGVPDRKGLSRPSYGILSEKQHPCRRDTTGCLFRDVPSDG